VSDTVVNELISKLVDAIEFVSEASADDYGHSLEGKNAVEWALGHYDTLFDAYETAKILIARRAPAD
jgi:hypothetical protein